MTADGTGPIVRTPGRRPTDVTRPEMVGKTYGSWTVLAVVEAKGRVVAVCICGTQKDVLAGNLLRGQTTSCGCQKSKLCSEAQTGHKLSGTSLYRIWLTMRRRCKSPVADHSERYLARGIQVCDRWSSDFLAFQADMGQPPDKSWSIDRIDNDAGYDCGTCEDCIARGVTKTNCRWATKQTQARNRSSNLILEYNGEKRCLVEWSQVTGIGSGVIRQRIFRDGWSVERALTTRPVQGANGSTYATAPTPGEAETPSIATNGSKLQSGTGEAAP